MSHHIIVGCSFISVAEKYVDEAAALQSSPIVLIRDSFGLGLNGWWIGTPDKTAVRLKLVKHVPLQALPSRPTSSAS